MVDPFFEIFFFKEGLSKRLFPFKLVWNRSIDDSYLNGGIDSGQDRTFFAAKRCNLSNTNNLISKCVHCVNFLSSYKKDFRILKCKLFGFPLDFLRKFRNFPENG